MIETIFPRLQYPKTAIRLGFPFKDDPPKQVHLNKSLLLCISRADMSTDYGYTWPRIGAIAEAPCWEPTLRFGGLRGWLYGHGDHAIGGYIEPTAKWLVVEAITDEIVEFEGICKFPRGKVRFVGTSKEAAHYLVAHEPRAREHPVIGEHRAVGDGGSVIVGALGAASAGSDGIAVAGYRGVASVGSRGTATAGFRGISSAGRRGTAIAGSGGVATAEDCGTAIVGFQGRASAGLKGQISIWYWDFFEQRYRMKVGHIGEEGLDPYALYTLNDQHHFIKV
ncbi:MULTISPECIES: hypothetical protein [unclassified Caballeronia]|uniref:hypothetical protein n=1 Tax=unclassified Caballeronia TaxID=2646786 RepID=UPI002856538C|nr:MULTISPECIES: hypothetical protein [unclassified Caballeronia]MDR5777600.1 hypothetical protein [Caballeronia sp. LZ002]MDR5802356.1 hypothetical protein [Caballeronia sp. LZ001]MDR5853026.1 hypothetical protein [Caballeronia sp. LZ003]